MQQPEETFDSFITDLKLKTQSCDFGELKDSMIGDQIVYGIYDKSTRERLLRDTKLTLEEAERLCHTSELALQHAKTFNDVSATVVTDSFKVAVVKRMMGWAVPQKTGKYVLHSCKWYGGRHQPHQCPAFGKMCLKCNGKNYFAKQCFSKAKSKTVRMVDETELIETFFVGLVSCEDVYSNHHQKQDGKQDSVSDDMWTQGRFKAFGGPRQDGL
uniref:Uncharacterized protein n=2 Tax=Iconisemion striatum TaxID=60296 RepID=A0A1A7YGS0_9TELE